MIKLSERINMEHNKSLFDPNIYDSRKPRELAKLPNQIILNKKMSINQPKNSHNMSYDNRKCKISKTI